MDIEKDGLTPASRFNQETGDLFDRLVEVYGTTILSGQQEAPCDSRKELDYIQTLTGRLPAILSLDYLNYSQSVGKPDFVTRRAADWHRSGGLVSICWHWCAPCGGASFYLDRTDFNLKEALGQDGAEYSLLLRDMETIAEELSRLRNLHVPVLWRPLHESDGGWFWWSRGGPEYYKQLYRLLYSELTRRGLDNLIWVWSMADRPGYEEWYPGDDVVDIIGADIYHDKGSHGASRDVFQRLFKKYGDRKMLAMSENGPLPDPDLVFQEGAPWLWFCTWWGGFITSEEYTSNAQKIKTYHHPFVATLDSLNDKKIKSPERIFQQPGPGKSIGI